MTKNMLSLSSLLSYGIGVWGSMLSSSSLQEIFKAQKACLHTINKAKKNTPTNNLQEKLHTEVT